MRKTQPWPSDLRPVARPGRAAGGGIARSDGRERQTFGGDSLLVRYVNFVKLPHTVFALPFALLGVVYASTTTALTAWTALLVVVAFTAARFAAMGFNRIVDRGVDARNPRTRGRELVTGRLSVRAAGAAVVAGAAVFVVAAGLLNPLCLALSPVALAWILGYSYTKRWTEWSHYWLGASLAIAPVGGFLAVAGRWSEPWWTLLAVAGAVATWVAGFDIFYALQDEAFDKDQGLKSAVVRLGQGPAIVLAKASHGVTIALLVLFGIGAGFGAIYVAGVVVAAGLLAYEHRLVKPGDLSRLDAAFFTTNGVISIVVFAGALLDRIA